MFRFSFALILVVAAASAKHVKSVKRDREDLGSICYGKNYPLVQCPVERNSNYPVLNRFRNARSFEEAKQVLQSDGALESLCGEGKRILECLDHGIRRSPDECITEYESRDLTVQSIGKFTGLLEELCTDDLIERATQQLDCLEEDLIGRVERCIYAYPDKDCSHLNWDYSGSGDNNAIIQCYDEKYLKNCNASSVLECGVARVTRECGRDAESLTTTVGNAFLKRFPTCPENKFKRLMKLFKK